MDIDDLVLRLPAWAQRMSKARCGQLDDWTWYGYDILGNVGQLDALISPASRSELRKLGTCPVADIGCADGDLGFLLESQGHSVDLIDWPTTNWNGFRGARLLRERLNSGVGIYSIELDAQFQLPRKNYGVALFLGILYHLKNPYYVLETLAQCTRYCLLSTRIAWYSPEPRLEIGKIPVAYLLDPDECNGDATNYWIFSMAGLERLVARCGWEIRDAMQVGPYDSNPRDNDKDQRAFLLLKSLRNGA